MKMKRNLQYGLKTIGGMDGCRLCISYAGSCVDGWKDYYKDYKAPWQKWFKNPIFHNRSGYSDFRRKTMDRICDYDEGYDRVDAYEIGWCYKCKCNPDCPYKKKTLKDMGHVKD